MRPLCVDLDGTLVRTDTLVESIVLLLRCDPLALFRLPFWLRQGRAAFKQAVAIRALPDAALLPYDQELLAYLREQRAAGRTLILATGSDRRMGEAVASHLGIFDAVLASDGKNNLSGSGKTKAILAWTHGAEFDYIGNARPDLSVWSAAHTPLVANASRSLTAQVRAHFPNAVILESRRPGLRDYLRQLRLYQWSKNFIVIIPMITSHVLNARAWGHAFWAFFAFSFAASAVYLINDLGDLEADRSHTVKRFRPLASGVVPVKAAIVMMPLLFLLAAACCLMEPLAFGIVLLLYVAATFLYTWVVKRLLVLDVLWLAFLYIVRMIAGHAATGIPFSPWLSTFAMFLFFSLALIKRYAELWEYRARGQEIPHSRFGRGYAIGDIEPIAVIGTGCGIVAALVVGLYVASPVVQGLYRSPLLLLPLCPLMLYWICRIWIVAHRGHLVEDPVLFALKDRASHVVLLAALVVILLASFLPT